MIKRIAKDLLQLGLVETQEDAMKYAKKVLNILCYAELRRLTQGQVKRMIGKLFSRLDKGEFGMGGDWWKKGQEPEE